MTIPGVTWAWLIAGCVAFWYCVLCAVKVTLEALL